VSSIVIEALHEMRMRIETRLHRLKRARARLVKQSFRFGERHRAAEIAFGIESIDAKLINASEKLERIDAALSARGIQS
jgi:hypothetical protein